MNKKYITEALGAFALSFTVLVAVASLTPAIAIPLIAGLTLGLCVYSIGPISGCHINPSVTLAQLSIKKITSRDAVYYIIAQVVGALVAMIIARNLNIVSPITSETFSSNLFVAELIGAFFFNFGIASVVYGKAKEQMSGIVVGGSLLLGIIIASSIGSLGILNPAVSIALNSFTIVYVLGPIVGAILGAQAYKYLIED